MVFLDVPQNKTACEKHNGETTTNGWVARKNTSPSAFVIGPIPMNSHWIANSDIIWCHWCIHLSLISVIFPYDPYMIPIWSPYFRWLNHQLPSDFCTAQGSSCASMVLNNSEVATSQSRSLPSLQPVAQPGPRRSGKKKCRENMGGSST